MNLRSGCAAIIELLVPAHERIAVTWVRSGDFHSLVDIENLVRSVAFHAFHFTVLAEDFVRTVICVPNDERGGFFFLFLVVRHNSHVVVVLTGNCTVGASGIFKIKGEMAAREHGFATRDIIFFSLIPAHDFPIGENVTFGSGGSGTGHNLCVVEVKSGIGRSVGAVSDSIFNADTVGTFDDLAPLAVQFQLAGDPEAVAVNGVIAFDRLNDTGVAMDIRVPGCVGITPFVGRIRKVGGLVIRSGDIVIIHHKSVDVKRLRIVFVPIPAHEFIIGTGTCGQTDFAAIIHAEDEFLLVRAPKHAIVAIGHGVQEDTILDLAPLGINRKATSRQSGEVALLRTVVVQIPTFQDETCVFGVIVFVAVFIIRSNIFTIGDTGNRFQKTSVAFLYRISVAINIHSIHKGYGIKQTVITNVQVGHIVETNGCILTIGTRISQVRPIVIIIGSIGNCLKTIIFVCYGESATSRGYGVLLRIAIPVGILLEEMDCSGDIPRSIAIEVLDGATPWNDKGVQKRGTGSCRCSGIVIVVPPVVRRPLVIVFNDGRAVKSVV